MAEVFVLTGHKAIQKRLDKLGVAARRALGSAMFAEMNKLQNDIEKVTPKDRGLLKSSGVTTLPMDNGDIITVDTKFGGQSAPYGIFVEEGGTPHWPPPGALEGWGQRKLGQAGLDFVLRRAIARRGTPSPRFDSRFFAKNVFEKRQQGMANRISRDMFRRLKQQNLV